MKLIYIIILAILVSFIISSTANSETCPEGSYSIGSVCKAEPTGCPYGDSIPVDSPKCVAPEPIKVPEPVKTVEPEIMYTEGK